MPELLDLLTNHLESGTVRSLGRQIGQEEAPTEQALSMLLPMLLGGLSRNTHSSTEGRMALDRALERDHDGSFFDSFSDLLEGEAFSGGGGLLGTLGSLLTGGEQRTTARTTDADGILRHVLGDRRAAVEGGVSKAAGIDPAAVQKLLGLLAPMVLGALGKVKRQQGLDQDGVAKLLGRERQALEQASPGAGSEGLLRLLDSDREDQPGLSDDIANIGIALGNALLRGRGGDGDS